MFLLFFSFKTFAAAKVLLFFDIRKKKEKKALFGRFFPSYRPLGRSYSVTVLQRKRSYRPKADH